jgi:putative hemolysin
MDPIILDIVLLLICALLSAFFSGSESALFSLKKSDFHRYSHSKNWREKSLYTLMKEPQKVLITILTGNLFVNLAVSMISTKYLLSVWPRWGHFVSIMIVTPLLIIFCEISPKIMALSSYESTSRSVLPPLRFFHALLTPVRAVLLLFTGAMIKVFNLKLTHSMITRDELSHAVKLGEQHGVIGKNEGTFITNVLRFSNKDASNIMFPRSSAVFIPYGSTIPDAMKVFVDSGVIRAPIYRNDFDHVIGFIDSRDMIPYFLGQKKAKSINRFINEIKFFPASRELHDLLNDFLAEGIQIAIVVDEYGGTAGVVTLNKLLSELMGREMTKWEDDSKHDITRIDGNVSVISGEMQIEDFNYLFGERLESRNAGSIGGYIIERLSCIPKRGQELAAGKYILRVRYIRKNKIETVEVVPVTGGEGAPQ